MKYKKTDEYKFMPVTVLIEDREELISLYDLTYLEHLQKRFRTTRLAAEIRCAIEEDGQIWDGAKRLGK